VAALILDNMASTCNKPQELISSGFKTAHGEAFAVMANVMQDDDKTELKETWMEANIAAQNRNFVAGVLGLN